MISCPEAAPRLSFSPGRALALIAVLGLSACMSGGESGSEGAGASLRNLLRYGTTTEPPIAREPIVEAAECPGVTVAEGRSAIRAGEGASVRNQVSIANVARECIEARDGSVVVKVGVEGRALLGPGGGSGRFDVPVSFVLKRGDRVLVSRVKRVAVTIPPGAAQGSFVVVEGDLVVPAGTGEFDIEVGLGGSGAAEGSRRRRASR